MEKYYLKARKSRQYVDYIEAIGYRMGPFNSLSDAIHDLKKNHTFDGVHGFKGDGYMFQLIRKDGYGKSYLQTITVELIQNDVVIPMKEWF